jgi:hypothetical protein
VDGTYTRRPEARGLHPDPPPRQVRAQRREPERGQRRRNGKPSLGRKRGTRPAGGRISPLTDSRETGAQSPAAEIPAVPASRSAAPGRRDVGTCSVGNAGTPSSALPHPDTATPQTGRRCWRSMHRRPGGVREGTICPFGLAMSSVRRTAREGGSRSSLVRRKPPQALECATEEVHAGRRVGGGFFKERTADLIVTVGAHVETVPTKARTKMHRSCVNHRSTLQRSPRATVLDCLFVAVKEPLEVQPLLGD